MLALMPVDYATEQTNFAATPSTTAPGTTVTTGGVAHTKSGWTQVLSATNFDVTEIALAAINTATSGAQSDALLDVGIGGAGSETVIAANLPVGWRAGIVNQGAAGGLILPLAIPSGTRVAIRAQSLELTKAINVAMSLRGGPSQPVEAFDGVDTIGAVTASSQGTSHTAGNTGSFSSWTSFGSTTARDYRALALLVHGTMATVVMNNAAYEFQVGYSSTTLGAWLYGTTTIESTWGPFPPRPAITFVPAGTQLQVRGKCSGTAQALDLVLLGFY